MQEHVLADLLPPDPVLRRRKGALPPELEPWTFRPGPIVEYAMVHGLNVLPVVEQTEQRLIQLECRDDHDDHHRDGTVEVSYADDHPAVAGAKRAEERRPHAQA